MNGMEWNRMNGMDLCMEWNGLNGMEWIEWNESMNGS